MRKYDIVPRPCDTSEIRIVDLTSDGLPFLPVFAHTHYSRPGAGTISHSHPGFIEVLFCRRGDNTSFECEGEDVPFRPGDVFVAQPETRHHLKIYPKGLDMLWFWFRLPSGPRRTGDGKVGPVRNVKPELPLLRMSESENLVRSLRGLPMHFTGGDAIRKSFLDVWREYGRPREAPLRALRLRLAVYKLLLELHEVSTRVSVDRTPSILDDLLTEMRCNPGASYPIGTLTRRLGVNAVRLNQLFKRATGLPPHAFLTSLRIQQAKRLLQSGHLTVSAIALKLGYPSSQHFATQFRHETGIPPRSWRGDARLA